MTSEHRDARHADAGQPDDAPVLPRPAFGLAGAPPLKLLFDDQGADALTCDPNDPDCEIDGVSAVEVSTPRRERAEG